MKRRLILMRHAKSSWTSGAPTDHARPLNHRGRRDAPAVAARIVELGWRPELIVSSDSQRTRETVRRMLPALGDVPAQYCESLYHAGVHEIRSIAAELSDETSSVLMLGHNPGWQAAVEWFSGQWETLTTANAALLESEGGAWADATSTAGAWTLCDVVRPKEL